MGESSVTSLCSVLSTRAEFLSSALVTIFQVGARNRAISVAGPSLQRNVHWQYHRAGAVTAHDPVLRLGLSVLHLRQRGRLLVRDVAAEGS